MEKAPDFPDPRKDAVERMKAFQSLSSHARWESLAAVIDIGWKLINASPHREAILRRMDEREEERRQIQQNLFAQYAQELRPLAGKDESHQDQDSEPRAVDSPV